jgi:hypothetical protein
MQSGVVVSAGTKRTLNKGMHTVWSVRLLMFTINTRAVRLVPRRRTRPFRINTDKNSILSAQFADPLAGVYHKRPGYVCPANLRFADVYDKRSR